MIDFIFAALVGFFVGACGGFFCVSYVKCQREDVEHDSY